MSVKLLKIKHFYKSFFCINTTLSTCPDCPNISQHRTFSIRYPFPARTLRSRASVAESQLTYTTRSGPIFTMVSRHFSSHPFRGGSTTITSAYTWFFSYCSGSTSSALPTKNSTFSNPFNFAFIRASSMACGTISTP